MLTLESSLLKEEGEMNNIPDTLIEPSLINQKRNSVEEPVKGRSRERRLIVIIVVIVVSWLIVRIWAEIFEMFLRRVLNIPATKVVANVVVAIFSTIIIIWVIYVSNMDDMLSA